MRAGRPTIVADLIGLTPVRVRSVACDLSPDRPPASLAFGRLLVLEWSPSDAFTRFYASRFRRHHCDFTCASASLARDRPVSPNQSATAEHCGRDPLSFRTTGPTPLAPPRRHRVPSVGGLPWSGASLEVFVPCNARWSRSRYPGRPASGRSRFGVSSPPARARVLREPAGETHASPLRFSAAADVMR